MVWNKSGYHDRFSPQQMHIMDKQQKAEKTSKEESKKEKIKAIQRSIVELLKNEGIALSQVEIAEKIKEKDILVLEALNGIDKEIVTMQVNPIDETGNSTRWKTK